MSIFVYPVVGSSQDIKSYGLTKRELYAAMILQGFVSRKGWKFSDFDNAASAQDAVQLADALIKELENK